MAKDNKIKLPADKVADLQTAQRSLTDLLPELDKAEECGIECQELRSHVQERLQQVELLLTNYGPGIQPRR